ncbi:hypothetical protein GGI20_003386 [Coemansia sp. BCRC 34301]|nr:hypothetical protein GGI20_003386 [Coemansia sp. BCRC 34301]
MHFTSLNDPRLLDPTPLRDGLDDALATYVSADLRPRRDAPVPGDFKRVHEYEQLNQLVAGAQWRALALASSASIVGTTDRRALLKYWAYRALALTQIGASAQVERELGRVASVMRVSKWPFDLRVLRAQAPGLAHGAWIVSADRLSALLRACQRALPSDRDVWGQRVFRVTMILIRVLAEMRDSALAVRLLDQVLCGCDDALLLSVAARLLLQLGAVPDAERLFVRVEALAPGDALALMNRALYAVAGGKWSTARGLFADVAERHPDRLAPANNSALCDLYLGDPQAMLDALQRLMAAAPAAAGTSEELVRNYCTGLDLHYDAARLRDAKAKKLVDVATWAGDGFDETSFKLT